MNKSSILAISSSRVSNSGYLEKALPLIQSFLDDSCARVAFIPFAAADQYEEYGNMVREALAPLALSITVVTPEDPRSVLEECQAIMVGGGNTFKLLHCIYDLEIFELVKRKVVSGTPYIGWSAGANLTGLTIGTTNDMPIIEPRSFNALGLLPFQINPHYFNQITPGFNGETREQRLEQYVKMNPNKVVIGLPEGTALQLRDNDLSYMGHEPAILFSFDAGKRAVTRAEISGGSDLSYLLTSHG